MGWGQDQPHVRRPGGIPGTRGRPDFLLELRTGARMGSTGDRSACVGERGGEGDLKLPFKSGSVMGGGSLSDGAGAPLTLPTAMCASEEGWERGRAAGIFSAASRRASPRDPFCLVVYEGPWGASGSRRPRAGSCRRGPAARRSKHLSVARSSRVPCAPPPPPPGTRCPPVRAWLSWLLEPPVQPQEGAKPFSLGGSLKGKTRI